MAFKNLHEDLAELFAEEAPACAGRGDKLRRTQPRDLHKMRSEAWNAAHPLKCRLASERYRAENPEVLKGWKKANPEKVRAARLREFAKRREKRLSTRNLATSR